MKKVLVTGAAGTIGKNVIKYLLMEGKYEITALDLKSRYNRKVLKKYKKRINIIYADVTDSKVIEGIIKDVDYVIHLAGVMPPLADLNCNLGYEVDYKGTENLIRNINFYNPTCHFLYASSTSVYGKQNGDSVSVNSKIDPSTLDNYAKYKYESEELIKSKLKNYTIFRLPIVLSNPTKDNYVFIYKNDKEFEVVSDKDTGYLFAKALDKIELINKKTYNVGGGKECITTGKKLNNYIFDTYGITGKYIKTNLFIEKNFPCYILKDSDKTEEMFSFRNDSVASFFLRAKRKEPGSFTRRMLGKIFIRKEK